jgi:hypothetical protein
MKKIIKHFSILIIVLFQYQLSNAQKDSLDLEKIRTESGVDPTRVNSRVGYTILYFDQSDNRSQITNRASLTLGVNRWSFSVKPEITSIYNGVPGSGFQSGMGDMKFSILNAFYVKDKNAMAGAVEFGLPFAKNGLGTPYFTATPSITFSHSFSTSLIFAIQPQYTFDIAKDAIYPNISVLTVRAFLAKFTKTGYFFVFEPRPIYDFENEQFDFIIAPIIGKALGAGFNLIGILEIPTKQATIENRGIMFQFGFNKNF